MSALTDKELLVWGSQARRQMQAGHPACTCKVHLLDQRDLLQCMKTRKPWAGELEGESRWKEVAFFLFVCKADQTDAGWRSLLLHDEPGWAGGNID